MYFISRLYLYTQFYLYLILIHSQTTMKDYMWKLDKMNIFFSRINYLRSHWGFFKDQKCIRYQNILKWLNASNYILHKQAGNILAKNFSLLNINLTAGRFSWEGGWKKMKQLAQTAGGNEGEISFGKHSRWPRLLKRRLQSEEMAAGVCFEVEEPLTSLVNDCFCAFFLQ